MQFIQGEEIITCSNPELECTVAAKNLDEKQLSNRPYLVFGDIRIIFEIVFQQTDRYGRETGREYKVPITNDGYGTKALDPMGGYEVAIKRTEKARPPHLSSLPQVLSHDKSQLKDISYEEDEYHLAFLSNQNFTNGAVTLFYEGTKDLLGRHFPDGCYILPSSVHEVILLSKPHYLYRLEEVKDLPGRINSGRNIKSMDILSDRVLEFHAGDKTISYAGENRPLQMRRPASWKRGLPADPR